MKKDALKEEERYKMKWKNRGWCWRV